MVVILGVLMDMVAPGSQAEPRGLNMTRWKSQGYRNCTAPAGKRLLAKCMLGGCFRQEATPEGAFSFMQLAGVGRGPIGLECRILLVSQVAPDEIVCRLVRAANSTLGPDGSPYYAIKKTDPGGQVYGQVLHFQSLE